MQIAASRLEMTASQYGRYNRPSIAIALCLTSMTLFSFQDALIKWVTSDYWLIQLLFVRSCVIAVSSGLYISATSGIAGFKTDRPASHLVRTTINFTAFFTYYMAIIQMPLATATTIAMTAPLFMTALAGPLLGEPVGRKRQWIMLVGFIGTLIVIQPTAQDLNVSGTLYALAGALSFALLAIQSRKMSQTEASELVVFYAALGFSLVTGTFMLFYWVPIDLTAFWLMVAIGLIALFAQYTIVHAYQYAKVHVIAPLEYVTVLWATLIGWYIFAEHPASTMYIGAVLIIFAGLAICWYEKVEYGKHTAPPINPA